MDWLHTNVDGFIDRRHARKYAALMLKVSLKVWDQGSYIARSEEDSFTGSLFFLSMGSFDTP